jgi:hypothetical protein
VSAVCGVPVLVVDVVDMVAVGDGLVAATLRVLVVVTRVLDVGTRFALVPVPFVLPVQMAVVHVVDVALVPESGVPAVWAVCVVVSGVFLVNRSRHDRHLTLRLQSR